MRLSSFGFFSCAFAFFVILVGAFTRLTDAGLGCPDWPGCYGYLVLPHQEQALAQAQAAYPDSMIDTIKAHTEMGHRYIASLLGLFILCITGLSFLQKRKARYLALALSLLVILQGAFGMWTVTLKLLPIVVFGHLVLGLSTLSLLFCLSLSLRQEEQKASLETIAPHKKDKITRNVSIVCFAVLLLQIMLGAWVSTNYAALACPHFPGCHADAFAPLNFSKAFDLMGANHLENPLSFMDHAARMTIHVVHRIGALVLSLLMAALCYRLYRLPRFRGMSFHLGGLLLLQIGLGISNVVFSLPLWVAVAHNAMAGLLLLSFLLFFYRWQQGRG